jgi:hypothetical protein
VSTPKRPAPWDPLVDLDADEKDWPLGMGPDGELNIVREDEEEGADNEIEEQE